MPGNVIFWVVIVCSIHVLAKETMPASQPRAMVPRSGGIEERKEVNKTFEIPFQVSPQFWSAGYSFNCTVGTPPQPITFFFNTADGDTVIGASALKWEDGEWDYDQDPPYKNGSSSTYKGNILKVEIDASTNTIEGPSRYPTLALNMTYGSDDFTVGGVVIDDLPFITDSSREYKETFVSTRTYTADDNYYFYTIGLGLPIAQTAIWTNDDGNGRQFPTFVQQFVNKGIIDSNTFSFWLDAEEEQTGHLLLGGINSERYQGALFNLPADLTRVVWYGASKLTRPIMTVRISFQSITSNEQGTPTPIQFDVENVGLYQERETWLSEANARRLWDILGATYDDSLDPVDIVPIVPCSYLSNTTTLDIKFTATENITVSVPISDMTAHNGTGPGLDEGPYGAACQLLIRATLPGMPGSLSGAIFKKTYTVYDLDNQIISIALTDFNSTRDNIIPIPKAGVAAIPLSAFGPSGIDGNSAFTKEVSGTSSDKKPLIIGLAVGIPVFLIICALIAFFLIRRHRRKTHYTAAPIQPLYEPEPKIAPSQNHSAAYLAPGQGNVRHSELYGDAQMGSPQLSYQQPTSPGYQHSLSPGYHPGMASPEPQHTVMGSPGSQYQSTVSGYPPTVTAENTAHGPTATSEGPRQQEQQERYELGH